MTKEMLTEEYFKTNEWSSWERTSWEKLTMTPSIIVTDCAKFLKKSHIAPIPQAYSLPSTFAQPMYIPGYTPPPKLMMMGGNNQVHPQGGYPTQGAAGGYPPQHQQQGLGGYLPQQLQDGYPHQGSEYPPIQSYPPQGGGFPSQ